MRKKPGDEQPIDLDRRLVITGIGKTLALLSISQVSCGRNDRSAGATAGPVGRPGDLDESTDFDVCIIGSGFAGGFLGDSLARNGIKVVILESGFETRSYSSDRRFMQLEVFRSSGPLEYPVAQARFRGVGGTSWLWGGFCSRLQPIDLTSNAYTPPGAGWPITYRDLEPYYEQVERTLNVEGAVESSYHPPRKTAYPVAADDKDPDIAAVSKAAGIVTSPQARCIPPFRVARNQIPRIQSSPSGAVIQGVTVTRLLAGEGGHVVGAETKDLDRKVRVVRARAYVVACGGLESPRLLLLSRSPEFQNGIGNNHDLVGRCFMEHRNMGFLGRVPVGWGAVVRRSSFNITYQFHKQFKEEGLGGIQLSLRLSPVERRDVRDFKVTESLRKMWSPDLDIGAGLEMQPSPQNRVTLDPELKDYFGNPVSNLYLSESGMDVRSRERARELIQKIYATLKAENVRESPGGGWAHHHMGTCRMGSDPRSSVVDATLRVHGTSNLFVAGSSVFVTSGCAGPTVTLSALALRLADHLRSQLNEGSFTAAPAARSAIGA
jgi:choline dehydrogenase-like flavoprotein